MTDVSNRKRQPRGVPIGGQFAANAHDEAGQLGDGRDWGTVNVSEGSRTPWGTADHAVVIADGIVSVSTPGHGGVKLSPERNREIHPALRNSSGWYEENVESTIPISVFPEEFASQPHVSDTAEELRADAELSIKHWFPSKWEAATGETLEPGESYEKDRQTWRKMHEGDFLTRSASMSRTDPDMVVVTAQRPIDGEEHSYMVPKSEYDTRANGDRGSDGTFIVDPSRHPRLPAKSPVENPYATLREPKPIAGLRDGDGNPIRATGAGADKINADLDRLWRSRDGEVRSLRDVLESGVVGKGAYYEGSRKKYSIEGPGSTAYPVSKATWDHLSQVPDTRSESTIASQELNDYQSTLERRRANYDPITPAHRERLAKLIEARDAAYAREKPIQAARQAQYVASEEARERAAKIEE